MKDFSRSRYNHSIDCYSYVGPTLDKLFNNEVVLIFKGIRRNEGIPPDQCSVVFVTNSDAIIDKAFSVMMLKNPHIQSLF
jgi:hypothetical protein